MQWSIDRNETEKPLVPLNEQNSEVLSRSLISDYSVDYAFLIPRGTSEMLPMRQRSQKFNRLEDCRSFYFDLNNMVLLHLMDRTEHCEARIHQMMLEINMSYLGLTSEMTVILGQLGQMVSDATSLESLQQSIVETIAQRFPYYNWTGFYMLDPGDPQTLVLGPFVGDPTPHIRIPVTEGICGAAVATGETVIVDDVNADPRYLSCSIKTRSEIVVPIYRRGEVVGEIDIDSHNLAAFTNADRMFLEEVAGVVSSYIEANA
jgi:L-methionine (R)-S-oxide reductase